MATQNEQTEGNDGGSRVERRIVGAINQNGRTFVAGDEDAFRAVLNARDIERLTAAGAQGKSGLVGDWSPPAEPADTSEESNAADDGASDENESTDNTEGSEGDDAGTPSAETAETTTPAKSKRKKPTPKKRR